MMKHVKLIVLCVAVLALLIAAATGSGLQKKLDVVGKDSVTAFGAILAALPEQPARDEDTGLWALSAPDGSARFLWGGSVLLEVDAAPFLKAGLAPEKLPANYAFNGSSLTVGTEFEPGVAPARRLAALETYAWIVGAHRDAINYHSFLDHYGVKAGGGNMFEWAKDPATNAYDNTVQDKDIVFALNPRPLVDAGIDPEKVEGWAYAQVAAMTPAGVVMEWNLLKPFNLQ